MGENSFGSPHQGFTIRGTPDFSNAVLATYSATAGRNGDLIIIIYAIELRIEAADATKDIDLSIAARGDHIDPDESTKEAIGDWQYWVSQGYCL